MFDFQLIQLFEPKFHRTGSFTTSSHIFDLFERTTLHTQRSFGTPIFPKLPIFKNIRIVNPYEGFIRIAHMYESFIRIRRRPTFPTSIAPPPPRRNIASSFMVIVLPLFAWGQRQPPSLEVTATSFIVTWGPFAPPSSSLEHPPPPHVARVLCRRQPCRGGPWPYGLQIRNGLTDCKSIMILRIDNPYRFPVRVFLVFYPKYCGLPTSRYNFIFLWNGL